LAIDWLWLLANLTWITGLALVLTAFGFARTRGNGRLAQQSAAWYTCLAGQALALVGLFLSGAAWNWIVVIGLGLVWNLLDRFVFTKENTIIGADCQVGSEPITSVSVNSKKTTESLDR
jgi:hypothetical protein